MAGRGAGCPASPPSQPCLDNVARAHTRVLPPIDACRDVANVHADAHAARAWRSGPEVIGEVHDNRCRGASHHDPLEWMISRFVDFHMRQPSRNVNEVALACDRTEFTMLSPPHAALSLEHVCNGFLLSVMVNTGLARRLDDKESAPQRGLHPRRLGEKNFSRRP